ncbi:MAG: 30S ribosomal protein S4 [Infirmifilum sp.]|jgi:small subunit ribosomal protein S4|uniref:Small ribosomal subunit protein uS4 n=1 Tax=Infirmifilum uzonense TaxID=1550241 RepID=A0A0F7FG36_9CREN|nr:30S ribosomal protein S4 [Infirmifilum uzonense]AKG38029.1 30S ribosomal protein S4 [Infirmifilum uzonense]
MGDPKKSRRKWQGPGHPWRKDVLEEEMRLLGEYGLRNKRELWIAESLLRDIRARARRLLALPEEERLPLEKPLVSRLYKLGILPSEQSTLDEILSLTVRQILERRLQTIVYRKGLASSMYHARQLITHGHIAIGGRRVNSPGYLVQRHEEDLVGYYPLSPLVKASQVAEKGE